MTIRVHDREKELEVAITRYQKARGTRLERNAARRLWLASKKWYHSKGCRVPLITWEAYFNAVREATERLIPQGLGEKGKREHRSLRTIRTTQLPHSTQGRTRQFSQGSSGDK